MRLALILELAAVGGGEENEVVFLAEPETRNRQARFGGAAEARMILVEVDDLFDARVRLRVEAALERTAEVERRPDLREVRLDALEGDLGLEVVAVGLSHPVLGVL